MERFVHAWTTTKDKADNYLSVLDEDEVVDVVHQVQLHEDMVRVVVHDALAAPLPNLPLENVAPRRC